MKRVLLFCLVVALLLAGCGADPAPQYLVSEQKFDAEGVENDYYITYEYDEKGNLLVESRESYVGGELETVKSCYNYAANGELKSITVFSGDEEQATQDVVCDKDGNIIQRDYGNYMVYWEYDENGNKIENWAEADGWEYWRYSYQYDTNGNMVEVRVYAQQELMVTVQYEYDTDGRLTRITENTCEIYNSKKYERVKYGRVEYNESGDTRMTTWYDSEWEELDEYTQCSYDSAGNVIEEVQYEDDEIVSVNTYKYIEIEK